MKVCSFLIPSGFNKKIGNLDMRNQTLSVQTPTVQAQHCWRQFLFCFVLFYLCMDSFTCEAMGWNGFRMWEFSRWKRRQWWKIIKKKGQSIIGRKSYSLKKINWLRWSPCTQASVKRLGRGKSRTHMDLKAWAFQLWTISRLYVIIFYFSSKYSQHCSIF